jgi:hypothetical protein
VEGSGRLIRRCGRFSVQRDTSAWHKAANQHVCTALEQVFINFTRLEPASCESVGLVTHLNEGDAPLGKFFQSHLLRGAEAAGAECRSLGCSNLFVRYADVFLRYDI